MPDVVNPSSDLFGRVQALNRRRSADWGRLAASVVPTVSAGLQGADPSATARSFYPTYEKGPDKLQVAAWKKSLLDAQAKVDDAKADRRATVAQKTQANVDKMLELMKTAATLTGTLSGDWATVANNVRDNQRQYGEQIVKALKENADRAAVQDGASVDRAYNALSALITPGGVKDPNFTRSLRNTLDTLAEADQRALMLKLDAYAEAHGESIGGILESMPNDQDAARSLQVFDMIRSDKDAVVDETLALQNATMTQLLETMPTGGGAGTGTVVDVFKKMAEVMNLGLSPEDTQRQLDGVIGSIEGKPADGAPDDVKKYADLMDELDSDAPAGNLAEARQRLFADPEFKAWMAQNGYSDPRMALKELRRMLRMRVHENQQKDMAVTRERRLAEVGPNSGTDAPSQSAAVASVGQPKAGNQGDDAVRFVMGPDGFYVWNGKAMTKATEEDLSILDPDSPDFTPGAERAILGPEEFDRLSKLAEERAPKPPPEPVTVGGRMRGPTLGMMQKDAQFALGHPAMTLGNVATLTRNKIAESLQKKREKKAMTEADEALQAGYNQGLQ